MKKVMEQFEGENMDEGKVLALIKSNEDGKKVDGVFKFTKGKDAAKDEAIMAKIQAAGGPHAFFNQASKMIDD